MDLVQMADETQRPIMESGTERVGSAQVSTRPSTSSEQLEHTAVVRSVVETTLRDHALDHKPRVKDRGEFTILDHFGMREKSFKAEEGLLGWKNWFAKSDSSKDWFRR